MISPPLSHLLPGLEFIFNYHAYPHKTGAEAVKIRFYDGFQFVVTFLAGFVPFSSNLLKNLQIFLFFLKQTDRHITQYYAKCGYSWLEFRLFHTLSQKPSWLI